MSTTTLGVCAEISLKNNVGNTLSSTLKNKGLPFTRKIGPKSASTTSMFTLEPRIVSTLIFSLSETLFRISFPSLDFKEYLRCLWDITRLSNADFCTMVSERNDIYLSIQRNHRFQNQRTRLQIY